MMKRHFPQRDSRRTKKTQQKKDNFSYPIYGADLRFCITLAENFFKIFKNIFYQTPEFSKKFIDNTSQIK